MPRERSGGNHATKPEFRGSQAPVLPAAGSGARGWRLSLPGAGRRRRRGRGAHGFAGLGRPRRETPAAQRRGDPPRPQRPPRRTHWAGASRGPAGGRASRVRVTLYLSCPRRAWASGAPPPTPPSPGWPAGRTQTENPGARPLITDTQAACQPLPAQGNFLVPIWASCCREKGAS